MAQRVTAFGEQRVRRYPWPDWTDGSTWEIRRGEDYSVPTENMRVNLHERARGQGTAVRTMKVGEDNWEGLRFQFMTRVHDTASESATPRGGDSPQASRSKLRVEDGQVPSRITLYAADGEDFSFIIDVAPEAVQEEWERIDGHGLLLLPDRRDPHVVWQVWSSSLSGWDAAEGADPIPLPAARRNK